MADGPRDEPDGLLLSGDDLSAWVGFVETHTLLIRRLDAHLVATHGMALVEYEVLFTLLRGGGRLRMAELADAALLSRSGLTRIVDVLVAQRLVRRVRDGHPDGRAVVAELTQAGRARVQAARRTHSTEVRRLLLDRLTAAQKSALAATWAAVHDALEDGPAPPGSGRT